MAQAADDWKSGKGAVVRLLTRRPDKVASSSAVILPEVVQQRAAREGEVDADAGSCQVPFAISTSVPKQPLLQNTHIHTTAT